MFHRVVRQIFQEYLLVASEERARVQQQFVHLLAVDENLSPVVHRHARHLTDEVVEHRAVGHIESRGIIYQRVAAIEHFYFRGRHHHIVERDVPSLSHLDKRHRQFFLLRVRHRHLLPRHLIARQFCPNQIVMLNGFDWRIIRCNHNSPVIIFNDFNTHGIQDARRAVRLIDRNLCHKWPFQKHILHLPHKSDGFLRPCRQ